MKSSDQTSRYRAVYYFGLIALSFLVTQPSISTIAGDGIGGLLARNGEAYALMFLIPAFWEAINVDGRNGRDSINQWFAWVAILAGVAFWLQSDLKAGMPQSFVTLSEAFVAALFLSIYFSWSRSRAPFSRGLTPLEDEAKRRQIYYAIAVSVALFATFQTTRDLFGDTASRILRLNGEAFGAMMIIPLYFDFVRDEIAKLVPSKATLARFGWYGVLLAATIVTRDLGSVDDAQAGLINQLAKATGGAEPFLATLVISAYFDFMAPEQHRPGRFHATGESVPHAETSLREIADLV